MRRRGRLVVTAAILVAGAAAGVLWVRSFGPGPGDDGGGGGGAPDAVMFRVGEIEAWIRPGPGGRIRQDGDTAILETGSGKGGGGLGFRFAVGPASASEGLEATLREDLRSGATHVLRRSRRIGARGRHRAEEAVVNVPGTRPVRGHRLAVAAGGGMIIIAYDVPEGGPTALEDSFEAALATLDWK